MSVSGDGAGTLASRLAFAALVSDNERLLKVSTALPALALLPEHLRLRDGVSTPFELVLDCVSTSAHFELKRLIGEQMTVSLKNADGRYVPWHGYVREAAQLGSDGGLARYRLTMGPWIDWLSLRIDSFVFQDKSALEIVEEVFADYPPARWRLAVSQRTVAAMRRRSLCTQYRESDLAFITRLLAQEGLHYWFEHLPDGPASAGTASEPRARHVLVIADAQVARTDLGPLRFAAPHPTAFEAGLEDTVTALMAQRRLTANAVARGSWDHARLAGVSATAQTALGLGDVPTLEHYDGSGADRFEDAEAAERAATQALAARELEAKRLEGIGAARILRPGATFSLVDHPRYAADTSAFNDSGGLLSGHRRADNAFTVLLVEHEASNNLGSNAARLLARSALERGTYKNRFECVPAAVPVTPCHVAAPTAPAALSARVVGVEGEVVTAERGHRVKVQMHFQRGERPNAGGASTGFGNDAEGNAPGDERSGTWVRVAGPAAGANWGSVYTPRIGAEVALQFIGGDIDRPVIVGALFGGTDRVPFAAGLDSGVNHPGVIAGLHSQRLDGGGFSQFALDDAHAQLRTRLHASHAASELALGHLIQQTGDSPWRGAWRGTGFEAGTQGWSTLRAGQGLLVSTCARSGTYGSAQSTQLDAGEAVAQLKAARDLGQRLAQAAVTVNAAGLTSHGERQALHKILEAIDVEQNGKHAASVNGQAGIQPGSDGRSAGEDPVHAFAQPVVVFDTPAALLAASSASVTAFAGQALSVVAQGDAHQTAAHTASQASGATTSVYAHQGGFKAIAAHGPVSLRAHTDAMSILADQSVTITSVNDEIRIAARQHIRLVAGQSAITLEGGDIEVMTPGTFTVQGATHAFEAGASGLARLPELPAGLAQTGADQAVIQHRYHDQEQLAGAPFRAILSDGSIRTGQLDGAGEAVLGDVPTGTDVSIAFGPMPGPYEPKDRRPMPDHKASPTSGDVDALIDKYSRGPA